MYYDAVGGLDGGHSRSLLLGLYAHSSLEIGKWLIIENAYK